MNSDTTAKRIRFSLTPCFSWVCLTPHVEQTVLTVFVRTRETVETVFVSPTASITQLKQGDNETQKSLITGQP